MEARAGSGNTAERVLELLERRPGQRRISCRFCSHNTLRARQLIRHGHVLVDGKRLDVPALASARDRSCRFASAATSWQASPPVWQRHSRFQTDWLGVEPTELAATVKELPDASSVPFPVNMQLVIEFYSQRT